MSSPQTVNFVVVGTAMVAVPAVWPGPFTRRLAAWIGASLDISISMSDLPRTVLPDSFYARVDETEQVALAWRLQRQLLCAA